MHSNLNGYYFEPRILGAALVHIASRREPVDPRWKKLVGIKLEELEHTEAAALDRYQSNNFFKDICDCVQNLRRGGNGFSMKTVLADDYLPYIFELLDVEDEQVRGRTEELCRELISTDLGNGRSQVGLAVSVLKYVADDSGVEGLPLKRLERRTGLSRYTFKTNLNHLEDYLE